MDSVRNLQNNTSKSHKKSSGTVWTTLQARLGTLIIRVGRMSILQCSFLYLFVLDFCSESPPWSEARIEIYDALQGVEPKTFQYQLSLSLNVFCGDYIDHWWGCLYYRLLENASEMKPCRCGWVVLLCTSNRLSVIVIVVRQMIFPYHHLICSIPRRLSFYKDDRTWNY